MSDGLNRVTLLGHLGQDPELKTIPGGQTVLNIRLATTETYFDKSNTKQERTDWHTVVVWGKRAEGLASFLTKGMQVLVEGRLQTRSYEKAGEKRYATDVQATNVVVCGRRDGEGGGRAAAPRARTPTASASVDDQYASRGGGGGTYVDDGSDDIPFAFCGDVTWRAPKWERW